MAGEMEHRLLQNHLCTGCHISMPLRDLVLWLPIGPQQSKDGGRKHPLPSQVKIEDLRIQLKAAVGKKTEDLLSESRGESRLAVGC